MAVRWAAADIDGGRVAEGIDEVSSVDVAADGGTTRSVFESFTRPAFAAEARMVPDPAALLKELVAGGRPVAFVWDFLTAALAAINAAAGETAPALEHRRRAGSGWAGAGVNDLVAGYGADPLARARVAGYGGAARR